MALEGILRSIEQDLREGNGLMAETREEIAATRETMAATRETLTEVRWELQLSRATSERQLEQQDDLRSRGNSLTFREYATPA